MRRPISALLLGFVLLATGCPPERPDLRSTANRDRPGEGRIVAEVSGEVVTLQDFRRRIDRLPSWGRARLGTVEARQNHLRAVGDFELLADEAERAGYAKDPRVVATVKRVVADQHLDELVRKSGVIPDADAEDDGAKRREAEQTTLKELRKSAKIEVDDAAVENVKVKAK